MSKLTDELEAQLRSQHGDLVIARTPKHGDLAFKCPTDTDHEEFQEAVTKAKTHKSAAVRQYVLSCLVFPKREEAAEVFSKLPALPPTLADKLSDLAGADIELNVKKG
ncbi:MAG: hypothetical protein H0U56_15645 [Methylibium sp.]|nr:hypothetical protein [Methylibium sp.]